MIEIQANISIQLNIVKGIHFASMICKILSSFVILIEKP